MDEQPRLQTWELWVPGAGATGLLFARARIDPAESVWVHAAPATLAVTVRDHLDERIARETSLERSGERLPMTRLSIAGSGLTRDDRWPDARAVGEVVLLHGGEAGVLSGWWNAEDGSEWRWQLEFYNRR